MPRLAFSTPGSMCRPALVIAFCLALSSAARAQEPPPPAYLAVVEGVATLERNGESEPAMRDMPFVEGDRLRTENGRVEIQFPDGTAIEVAENSLVEAVTSTRVRLLAGAMEHLQRPAMEEPEPAGAAPPISAPYLPQDLQTYGSTFDRYGSWQYAAPYGYVWYPTVAAGWRPYYNGRWSAVPRYGWTWLGIDAWSYPTHHYGRWGYARNAWFWIPGRTWGAAWVSWGAAPDYVSWCPLGYDNRPVFALSVNSYDSWRRGGGGWFGWTVMSRSHFGGRGYYANRYAVEPRSLPSETPFIFSSRPPVNLPHQRSRQAQVAGRQPSGDGRALAVERRPPSANDRLSAVGGRQAVIERGAAAGGSAQRAIPRPEYGSGQPVAGSRESAFDNQTVDGGQIARPRTDYGVPRRYRPSNESAAPDNVRPPTGFGVPRRAYPLEAPRAAAPEPQRIYPHAVPRGAPASPVAAPSSPITVPEYRSHGARVPDAQPQRWRPSYGAPTAGGAPAQRAPSPAASGAPVRTQPSPQAPPPQAAPPPASDSGRRNAPAGSAREGTAQPRSGGQGAPAGARRPR